MNVLYPQFPAGRFRTTLRIAILGAMIAAPYGMAHDQISYTISPEYFTKMKFRQFAYADFGWHPRFFAAEVGFLATWWVGLLAGWFLARGGLAELPAENRRRCMILSFAIVFLVTVVVEVLGATLGIIVTRGNLDGWSGWQRSLNLDDLPAFATVAYLHYAAYLGGAVG